MWHFCQRTQDITSVWMWAEEFKTSESFLQLETSCFNVSELLTLAANNPSNRPCSHSLTVVQ